MYIIWYRATTAAKLYHENTANAGKISVCEYNGTWYTVLIYVYGGGHEIRTHHQHFAQNQQDEEAQVQLFFQKDHIAQQIKIVESQFQGMDYDILHYQQPFKLQVVVVLVLRSVPRPQPIC